MLELEWLGIRRLEVEIWSFVKSTFRRAATCFTIWLVDSSLFIGTVYHESQDSLFDRTVPVVLIQLQFPFG